MGDRRRRAAPRPPFRPDRVPTGRRDRLGATFALSPAAMAVLRAIRGEVTDEGTFRGSDARAAFLADIGEDQARGALIELGSKGYVRLRRAPAPRA